MIVDFRQRKNFDFTFAGVAELSKRFQIAIGENGVDGRSSIFAKTSKPLQSAFSTPTHTKTLTRT
jgi:hypothetical protein